MPLTQPTFAVIGSGAIGGYYGGLLTRAGYPVHFLARSDADHLRRHGLRVDSSQGGFHLPLVQVATAADPMPPCDVALICLKTTHNPLLKDLLPRILKPGGLVVCLQNGYGVEAPISRMLMRSGRKAHVIGGLCFVCSQKIGPGHVHHQAYGQIRLGLHRDAAEPTADEGATELLLGLIQHLQAAGMEARAEADLLLARWQKLLWNIPFNGLSALLHARTDQLLAEPGLRAEVLALMDEVVLAARLADQREIPAAFVQQMIANTEKMPPYQTSMLGDRLAGRPMEVQAIFGQPLAAVSEAHPAARLPRIQALCHQLDFLNRAALQGVPDSHPPRALPAPPGGLKSSIN